LTLVSLGKTWRIRRLGIIRLLDYLVISMFSLVRYTFLIGE